MIKKPINLRIDVDLLEEARRKAESIDVSLTSLIEQGLRLVLDSNITQVNTNVNTAYLLEQIEQLDKRINQLECKDNEEKSNNSIRLEDISSMRRDKLRKYAYSLGIKSAWTMKKGDLVEDVLKLLQDK